MPGTQILIAFQIIQDIPQFGICFPRFKDIENKNIDSNIFGLKPTNQKLIKVPKVYKPTNKIICL